jgi:putative aldouronate transport system permease protein
MILPALIALYIFSYRPMYGVIIAFKDFSPIKGFGGSPWVGLEHFERLFSLDEFPLLLRNTITIALGKILFTQLTAVVFAIALNEIKHKLFKRSVQTIVYMPHFLSWIILGGVFLDVFSLNGIVNRLVSAIGFEPISFFGKPGLFQPIVIGTHVWKEFGWSAIIYIAALTNIDPHLYEAAAVDGANRLQKIWYITIPGILSTVVLIAALSLGNVLNAGFNQILVLYNPIVRSTGDVISTYVYRAGLQRAQYSLATAVGLFKSIISLILIILSRWLADRLAGYRIF